MQISSRPLLTHFLNSIDNVYEVEIEKKFFFARESFEVHVPEKGRWEAHRLLSYNRIVGATCDYVFTRELRPLEGVLHNEIT